MQNITFDTHAFVKRLTGASMPEPQAEVLAEEQSCPIEERLATKQDLKALEVALKRDIKEGAAGLERDIKESEQKIIIRLGTLIVIGIGVLATLDKIL